MLPKAGALCFVRILCRNPHEFNRPYESAGVAADQPTTMP
jgi:hypothetical protein